MRRIWNGMGLGQQLCASLVAFYILGVLIAYLVSVLA